MAGPFLTTLGRSARMFYPVARAAAAQGRSLTSTLKLYRDAGNRIANETARSIFRTVLAHETAARSVQQLPRNRKIPTAKLPEALTKIRRAISFTVEIKGILPATGERSIRHVTISTNQELTPARIEALAEETVVSGKDRYGMEVEEATLIRGEKAGRLGRF